MPVLTMQAISKAHAAPEVSTGEEGGVWREGVWKREREYTRYTRERERGGGGGQMYGLSS